MAGKRGRPRAFDEDLALKAALATFVRRGLHEATLDELAAEMGINKPSLYGAFGDKSSLFHRVLAEYMAHVKTRITGAFAGNRDLDQTLQILFDNALGQFLPDTGDRRGCLVVSITSSAAGSDAALRAALSSFIDETDLLLQSLLTEHFAETLSRRGLTASQLAVLINNTVFGLALRARAGADRTTLRHLASQTLQLVAD